jgi:hypothetical protein
VETADYLPRRHAGHRHTCQFADAGEHGNLPAVSKTAAVSACNRIPYCVDNSVHPDGHFRLSDLCIGLGLPPTRPNRFRGTACLQFSVVDFFFNLRAYLFAFIWLILLWALVLAMILLFYRCRRSAALLQIPYLLWVTFAVYLSYSVWMLNR